MQRRKNWRFQVALINEACVHICATSFQWVGKSRVFRKAPSLIPMLFINYLRGWIGKKCFVEKHNFNVQALLDYLSTRTAQIRRLSCVQEQKFQSVDFDAGKRPIRLCKAGAGADNWRCSSRARICSRSEVLLAVLSLLSSVLHQ